MPGADELVHALAANDFAVLGRKTPARALLSAAAVTPITVFCRRLPGADHTEVRNDFDHHPTRCDEAVLFWMIHDCHTFGALDDFVSAEPCTAPLEGPAANAHVVNLLRATPDRSVRWPGMWCPLRPGSRCELHRRSQTTLVRDRA